MKKNLFNKKNFVAVGDWFVVVVVHSNKTSIAFGADKGICSALSSPCDVQSIGDHGCYKRHTNLKM